MERMLDLPWQNAQWSGVCICKDAPADMVVALGSHYQRLFIIPSLKAVIVRQGIGRKLFGRAVSAASSWARRLTQRRIS